jgi:hypothetical protein
VVRWVVEGEDWRSTAAPYTDPLDSIVHLLILLVVIVVIFKIVVALLDRL